MMLCKPDPPFANGNGHSVKPHQIRTLCKTFKNPADLTMVLQF